ncbi:glycosyltransferase [Gammaproteobacteria bacterium]|nr:glycosyltransferase [Gammaproteobacteria bacterium]
MKVFHILNLKGIGGVQSQFEVFYNNLSTKQKSYNFILNISGLDPEYSSLKSQVNRFLYKFLIYLVKNDIIIHSYNNLISKKFYYLYSLIRPSNLIFHERGNAWNLDTSKKGFLVKNANLSKLIVCNSESTKIILNKKFGINLKKLKVIYNGVISDQMILEANKPNINESKDKFIIGYVGRLETNKGVHTLIKSMQYLDNQKFQLNIIGDGSLREELEKYTRELGLKSVNFLGRITNAWSKIKNFDVIVVPSIREPLGNVIIEAALHKVPIIASRVDGIAEIIDDYQTGILLTPSLPVNNRFVSKAVPLPEFVVDILDRKLKKPMELDSKEIMTAIKFIKKNKITALEFSDKLYTKVIDKFHIQKYTKELMQTYHELL